MDPDLDLAIFVSDFKTSKQNCNFVFFTFISFFKDKSHKEVKKQ
jgi:hypothetical protein